MSADHSSGAIADLGTVFVPVSDQDRALAFYVETLGFEKRSDFEYADGKRWVEVAPAGATIALALVSASEGLAAPTLAARCAFMTDGIDALVARLRSDGVEVEDVGRKGTSRRGLLSTDVIVNDPFPPQCCVCDPDGNRFLLVQPS